MSKSVKSKPHCLVAALEYLSFGWSAIALCPPSHAHVPATHTEICTKPGKVPVFRWAEFQKRLPKEFEIEQWWEKCPEANVGVAMGNVSGILGIDIDSIEGDMKLKDLSHNDLPKTLMFNTGRDDSYRLLYSIPKDHPCPIIPFRDGEGKEPLKILGNGSQTVMPPSTHASGDQYAWVQDRSPKDLQIAPAPKWILDLLLKYSPSNTSDTPKGAQAKSPKTSKAPSNDGGTILEGGRDSMLTAIAGAVRRYGCTKEEIEALLSLVNQRCEPNLPTQDIRRIARSIAKYNPEVVPSEQRLLMRNNQKSIPQSTLMEDVLETPLDWLWPGWLPLGHLVCVDGDGGVGKSTMLIDLVARLTRGTHFPDRTRPSSISGPVNTLMVACEDSLSSVIKARLTAAKADQKRVLYLETVLDTIDAEPRMIEFPKDLTVLEDVIHQNQIRFCFIDPILAFLSGETSYSSDQDVRRTLGPLKRIAEQHQCTIAYIRHLNKGSVGNKATYRGGGSLAFINAARTGLFVGKHPERKGVSVVCLQKTNFSIENESWMFETVPVPNKMGICSTKWIGATDMTADQINNANSQNEEQDKNELEQAEELLTDVLKHGPKSASDIMKEAKQLDISGRTMHRAKQKLGIKHKRTGFNTNAGYIWELPTNVAPNQPDKKQQAASAKEETKEETEP